MFQGNDASSRWTATQQTRRKADPIVWMCSVQQQVKEWKSFCNNGTFCQRHRSRLCLLFIKLHSSRPRLVSIKLHSSSPRPLSITLFSSRSPLLSIKLYIGHASSLSNYTSRPRHALSLSKYTITGHSLVVSESDQGYYFTHQTPTHPPIHPKYHLST